MSSLKEVRGRIKSVMSTQQITKAMKMVAAAKLRKSQEAVIQLRPYAHKLNSIMTNVSSGADIDLSTNPYSEVRSEDKVLIIIISSDRGLCGGFNTNVIKATNILLNQKYKMQAQQGNVSILTLGKRSNDYFLKSGCKVISDYSLIFSKLNFEEATKVAERVMAGFVNKEFDKVELVYNEFKNVATQEIRVEQFLPMASSASDTVNTAETDYLLEPSRTYIIEELVPISLRIQFYKAVLESNASEHGARMTAMDKATENAGELLKELKLMYNRTRQAAITNEILEIVAGANALAGK
ncbi:MAG TPA: ATP synthase F1 subunit gamma [Cytophagales bacterium]|nr:ATP synthase F1 subunit gamma [Cytophagales bacterium]